MQNFPFDEYSFKFLSIERPKDDLKALLMMNGYKLARTLSNYGETLWANEKLIKLSEQEVDDISKSLGISSYCCIPSKGMLNDINCLKKGVGNTC